MTGLALGAGVATAAKVLATQMNAAASSDAAPAAKAKEPSEESEVHFIEHGPAEGRQVALTFDDGPNPDVTDRILDELKQRGLRASFFMIGQNVVARPELARRVKAEGHEIANHSFTHPKLSTMPDSQVDEEIQKTQDTFGEILGHQAIWFRPPYGAFRKNQAWIPQGKGLGIVYWDVDTSDWAQPGEDKIVEAILGRSKPGSIVLCHDAHRQTADCLGRVLDGLLERDFKLSTLSELLVPGTPSPKA